MLPSGGIAFVIGLATNFVIEEEGERSLMQPNVVQELSNACAWIGCACAEISCVRAAALQTAW